MREFTTAAKFDVEEEDEPLVFIHDGREVRFFEPSAGQLAIMATLSMSKEQQTVRQLMTLFFSVMDEDTYEYFESRLMDRKDTFDLDTEGGVLDIYEFLMEEWSGKPSKQPSDYQPPRKSTGRSSTGSTRAKASTSSRSRSTASSTSSKRG